MIHNFVLPADVSLGIYEPTCRESQTAAIRRLKSRTEHRAVQDLPGVFVLDFDVGVCRRRYHACDMKKCGLPDARRLATGSLTSTCTRSSCVRARILRHIHRENVWYGSRSYALGGVVGEEGVHGIALGHTYPGNVYREVQRKLLQLYRRGVLLAITVKIMKPMCGGLSVASRHATAS